MLFHTFTGVRLFLSTWNYWTNLTIRLHCVYDALVLLDLSWQIIGLVVNFVDITVSKNSPSAAMYIHDGTDMDASILGSFSGLSAKPLPSYLSSQPYVLIRFVSFNDSVSKGFNLSYTLTTPGYLIRVLMKVTLFYIMRWICVRTFVKLYDNLPVFGRPICHVAHFRL